MKIEPQDLAFSLDQPEKMLNSLVKVLQQMLSIFKMRAPEHMPDYRNLLIIDEYEHARYLAHLLVQAGYRPLVMSNALEAFTRFLQVPFVPFALILGHEDSAHRLFLQRLLQQTAQKYQWEIPLIRLHYLPSNQPSQQMQTPDLQPPPTPPLLPQTPSPFAFPTPQPSSPPLPETTWPQTYRKQLSQPLAGVPMPQEPSIPPDPDLYPTQPSLSGIPQLPAPPPSLHAVSLQPTQPVTGPFPPAELLSASAPTSGPLSQETRPQTFLFDAVARSKAKTTQKVALQGQNIGRYHILTALGNSPTSNVYKTYDRLRETDVALKAVQTDALPYYVLEKSVDEYDLFQMEAEILRNIDHPHVVKIWNCGKSYISGTSFMYKSMPFYADGSLSQWLFQRGSARSFSPKDVCHVVLQIADALQYLHNRHIIFQNFKLTNLLVRKSVKHMSQLHVMLVDFAPTQDGTFFSRSQESFPYVAPERWYGQVSPASDQYGLAAIAYELLTGKVPFQGSSEHVMKLLHTSMKPQPPGIHNSMISPALDNVLLRALSKRPEERFSSISLFAKTFEKYAL